MMRMGRFVLSVVSAVALATAGAGGVAAERLSSDQGQAGSAPMSGTSAHGISGRLTNAAGSGIAGINVRACNAADDCTGVTTDASGAYSIDLAPDAYDIELSDPAGIYPSGYYDPAVSGSHYNWDINSSGPATIDVSGGSVGGINVVLPAGVHIKGHIANAAGTAIPAIEVTANSGNIGRLASTDASGNYSILVAPNRAYQLWFADASGHYQNGEWSAGGFTTIHSEDNTVAAGTSDVTINVTLPSAGYITFHAKVVGGASLSPTDFGLTYALASGTPKAIVSDGESDPTVAGTYSIGGSLHRVDVAGNTWGLYGLSCTRNGAALVTTTQLPVQVTAGAGDRLDCIYSYIYTPASRIGTFTQLGPVRILDTRTGGSATKLTAAKPRAIQVAGVRGVPPTAIGVTGTVTVVAPTVAGYLYLGPESTTPPTSSSVNFTAGQVIANGFTLALNAHGQLYAIDQATRGQTDIVIDITGYFLPGSSANTYHAITPTRVADSRYSIGIKRLAAGSAQQLCLASSTGVSASTVAVTGNLTAVNPTRGGYLALTPVATSPLTTSSVNFLAGAIRAAGVTTPTSGNCFVIVYNAPAGSHVDAIFDLTGYYSKDAGGSRFVAITPFRALDTRNGTGLSGKFISDQARGLTVTGAHLVPADATAVSGDIVAVAPPANGWGAVTPTVNSSPLTSTVNFLAGNVLASGVVTQLSAGGIGIDLSAQPGRATDVVFDVTGYFVP